MKTIKSILLLAFIGLSFVACSDDDNAPAPVNEEETITTMRITLVPAGGGTSIILETQDLDGDGPNEPDPTVSGNLTANTTYTGSIVFLNETESPAEDITEEVEEEDDEHQVFYIPSGSISSITYNDQDGDGNPLGLAFTLETGAAGNATLEVSLVHEPKKPNDGTLADAGGETDFTDTYAITVE
jgi:hypothetical protein